RRPHTAPTSPSTPGPSPPFPPAGPGPGPSSPPPDGSVPLSSSILQGSDLLQAGAKTGGVPHISLRRTAKAFDHLFVQLPHSLCRRADDKRTIRKDLTFRNQRASTNQAVVADNSAVQDGRAHTDQRIVADGATVKDRAMTNGAALAYCHRIARVSMYHHMFLQVRPVANCDLLVVAPQHRAKPDADIASEPNFADDRSVGRNPAAIPVCKLRFNVLKCIDRHSTLLS